MKPSQKSIIGFTCAYTPLALIDAAGFIPYRLLPMGDSPHQAGRILHDNLCPHVKRILDRGMANDLPDLIGLIVMNSCDAMRRLADAWRVHRPQDPMVLVDLPTTTGQYATQFFAAELKKLTDQLMKWSGSSVGPSEISDSISTYNHIANLFQQIRKKLREGTLNGGSARCQELYNNAATQSPEDTINSLITILAGSESATADDNKVPVFVFGNVLPEPEIFQLFEKCGARIVCEDTCTGRRMFSPFDIDTNEELHTQLAQNLLHKPPCARTFESDYPGKIGESLLRQSQRCNAKGVIGYTMKFCDPYLARIPIIKDVLKEAQLPLLLLEGDCTQRTIGQQQTRIEAFVEMLR